MSSAEELKNKGNEFYKKREYKKAIEFYTKAIEADPKVPAFYTNRATCNINLKNFSKAVEDCDTALELDPTFLKAYFRSCQAYLGTGNLERAKFIIKKAQGLNPNNPSIKNEAAKINDIETYLKKGHLSLERKEYQQAKVQFELALEKAKYSDRIKLSLGEALIGLKKFEDAQKLAQSILQNSNNPDAFYLKGRALYYAGNSTQGLRFITQCRQLDPDHSSALKFRKLIKKLERTKEQGNEKFKAGQLDEAYKIYQEAAELDPMNNAVNAQLYSNMAAVAIKQKKFEQGLQDSSKAIELDENYTKAYLRRAQCNTKLEKYEEATYDLSSAQRLEPNDPKIARLLKQAQTKFKSAKKVDYYKVLGVERDATENQIKRAFKKAAAKTHPDRFVDPKEKAEAEKKFKLVNEAHRILSDEKARYRYDNGMDENGMGDGPSMADMGDIFSMFMGGMGGRGGGNPFGGMGGMGGRRGGGNPFGGMGGQGGGNPFQFFMGGQQGGQQGGHHFHF